MNSFRVDQNYLLSLQFGKGGQEIVPDWKFVGQKVQRSFGKVAK